MTDGLVELKVQKNLNFLSMTQQLITYRRLISNLLVDSIISDDGTDVTISSNLIISGLTSQLVVTNGSKQLVSSTDISSLTLTLDGGTF